MGKRNASQMSSMVYGGSRSKSQRKAYTKSYATKKVVQRGNVSYVNGRITSGPQGPEEKMADLVVNGQTISNGTPYLISLTSGLPENASSSGRIGERVKFRSLMAKINLYTNAAVAAGGCFAKWSLVLDKQSDGTTTTPAVIYSVTNSNNTQLNRDGLERFQVLAQGNTDQALFTSATYGQHLERFIPLDIGARFTDATNEAITNAIYFVVTTSATIGNPLLMDCNIRLKWIDE